MLKSKLKSLPNEDAQGNVHPMRRLYACSFASGARDTAAKHDVVVRQVNDQAVETVRDRRAGRTPRRVVGPEHEMVDEQLRAALEQVRQRGAPRVGLESIFLVDPNPWQLLTPRASSSLRRVSSFSALSNSSRAASHSSRVPVMWRDGFPAARTRAGISGQVAPYLLPPICPSKLLHALSWQLLAVWVEHAA